MLLLLIAGGLFDVRGQQGIAPGPTFFEVESVKVNNSGQRAVSIDFSPDRGRIRNCPLLIVLMKVYNINNQRQLSNPGSVRSINRAEMLRMLQSLLADRFKLAMQTETKEVSGYALVVEPTGQKLRQHASEGGDCEIKGSKGGEFRFENCAMDYLASFFLSGSTDKLVAEKTGLTGGYDFELFFSMERAANPGETRPDATVTNPDAPSIFTALRQQLGLRLRAEKITPEFFSIDHPERPSENRAVLSEL
jgi:uncharacterized protein (TIGR03435 family)